METESSDTVDTKAVEAQHRKVEPYSGAVAIPPIRSSIPRMNKKEITYALLNAHST